MNLKSFFLSFNIVSANQYQGNTRKSNEFNKFFSHLIFYVVSATDATSTLRIQQRRSATTRTPAH